SWTNALGFSAQIWMPWSILAPVVFWFSVRFPLELGHLLKSVPVHLLACTGCVAITLSLATSFSFAAPTSRTEDRPPPFARGPVDRDGPDIVRRTPAAVLGSTEGQRNSPTWTERTMRGEKREMFGRRGPIWWPLLGATLLRANFDAAV